MKATTIALGLLRYAIINPLIKGPITEPNNQAVLDQVMARGISCRGISIGNKEKDAGAINARIIPFINMDPYILHSQAVFPNWWMKLGEMIQYVIPEQMT